MSGKPSEERSGVGVGRPAGRRAHPGLPGAGLMWTAEGHRRPVGWRPSAFRLRQDGSQCFWLSPLTYIAARWVSPVRQVRKEASGEPVNTGPHQAVEEQGVGLGPCVQTAVPAPGQRPPRVGVQGSLAQGVLSLTKVSQVYRVQAW